MRNPLGRRALFTASAFFILGILISEKLIYIANFLVAFFLLFMIATIHIYTTRHPSKAILKEKTLHIALISLIIGLVYFGCLQMYIDEMEQKYIGESGALEGYVSDIPQKNGDSVVLQLSNTNLKGQKIPRKVRVYITTTLNNIRYGDELFFEDVELRLASPQRNPNGNNARKNAQSRGEIFYISAKNYQIIGHNNSLMDGILSVRERLLNALEKQMPAKEFGVLKGMVFGDKTQMQEEWLESYRMSGVAHILSVSGLHVGIISACLFALTKKIKIRYLKEIIIIFGVLGYAALCGFSAPVVRATILSIMLLGSQSLGEKNDSLTSLAVACLLIAVPNPYVVFSASFILSFSAVLGIILLNKPILDLLDLIMPLKDKKVTPFIKSLLSVSISAQLGILPAQLKIFGTLPLLSIFINLIVIPASTATLIIGLIAAILSAINPILGAIPCILATWGIRLMNILPIMTSRWKWASLTIGAPSIYEMIAIIFVGLSLWKYTYSKKLKLLFSGMAMIICCISSIISVYQTSHQLKIIFLDVGQGDAAYIQQGDYKMLIDGGARQQWGDEEQGYSQIDYGKSVVIPFLRNNGISELDAILVSHPDSDHCGGLYSVVKEVPVGQLLTGPDDGAEDETYLQLLELSNQMGIKHIKIKKGDQIKIGKANAKVIWPEFWMKSSNESSLMLSIQYADRSIMFTGDLGLKSEKALLQDIWQTDILKVGHHGSSGSTSDDFLQRINPQVSIISVGERNRYGHPTPELLERLKNNGTDILTTAKHGALTVKIDKNGTMKINSEKIEDK